MKYTQCVLVKTLDKQIKKIVTYIPSHYAKKNQVVKIRDEEKNWDDGWVVDSVGQSEIFEKDLPDYRKMIRNHRKNTGDSMPKV